MPPDYYKILGISHTADLTEIKQAAQTRANEIKTAYAVLSHPDTRATYDANPSPEPHNHYATLAVNRKADLAQLKAAAQARIAEIKQAYESLSKPDARAAYDAHQLSVKPIPSVALPESETDTIKKTPDNLPKTVTQARIAEVKQATYETLSKSDTRAACDAHQLSVNPIPSVASPESETDTTRKTLDNLPKTASISYETKNCAICKAVIRCKAKICPRCGVRQPDPESEAPEIEQAERSERFTAFIIDIFILGVVMLYVSAGLRGVPVLLAPAIGVIITTLLLLHRHGQTIGKHLCSIKMVKTDGSRVGLLTILSVRGIANTMVVKVFPSEAAAPVLDYQYDVKILLLTILKIAFLFYNRLFRLFVNIETTRFTYIETSFENTGVRQGKPADEDILLLLAFFFGWMGAHHFYLGSYLRGTLYLLFFWTMIPLLLALLECWDFYSTSYDSIRNRYTAHNSDVAFVFIPVLIVFMTPFGLAQWTLRTERTKVSEAVKLLNSLEAPAEQYMTTTGEFPPTIEAVTNKTSDKTLILSSNPVEGYFQATFNQKDKILANKVIRLVFHRDTGNWVCRVDPLNAIPQEYLPEGCNSTNAEIAANRRWYLRR